jgi:hypothetical protein
MSPEEGPAPVCQGKLLRISGVQAVRSIARSSAMGLVQ